MLFRSVGEADKSVEAEAEVEGGYVCLELMVDAVGVKLAEEGSEVLLSRGMSFGELVCGTKDDPGFLETCV